MTDLSKKSVAALREGVRYYAGEAVQIAAVECFDEVARRLEEAQGAIAVSEEDKELLEAIEPFVDGSCYLAEPGGKENIGATALIRGLAKKLKRRITGEGR